MGNIGAKYSNPNGSGGSSGSSSCFGTLGTIVLIGIIAAVIISKIRAGSSSEFASALPEFTNNKYSEVFDKREDCLLLVITDTDLGQASYGNSAASIMDKYIESMWKEYKNNEKVSGSSSEKIDRSEQVGNMFKNLAKTASNNNVEPIKSEKDFDSKCFLDNIDCISDRSVLIDGAKQFYETTGIQPYVMFVTNKAVKRENGKMAGVVKVLAGLLKTFIIAIIIIIVIIFIIVMVVMRSNKKKKEQEDLERILSKPLETFGKDDDIK